MIDWTVSLGGMINILMVIVGGIGSVWTLRNFMEKSVAMLNLRATLTEAQLAKIDLKLEEHMKVMIDIARQEVRMDGTDSRVKDIAERLTTLERRVNK